MWKHWKDASKAYDIHPVTGKAEIGSSQPKIIEHRTSDVR